MIHFISLLFQHKKFASGYPFWLSFLAVYLLSVLVKELKFKWKGLRDNYRRCIQNRESKQKSGAASSKLPICRYFEQLGFMRDAVTTNESDPNTDIEFVQPNKPEGDEEKVQPETPTPVKKQKIEPYRKTKTKQVKEETFTDLMIKQTVSDIGKVTVQISKQDDDDTDTKSYFCKSLIGRLKSLPVKKIRLARRKIEDVLYDI